MAYKRKPRNSERIPESTRRWVLKNYPYCWLRYPGRCTDLSEQVHHILDDADGGGEDKENLRGVCKACHEHHSAIVSQEKSVKAAWEFKRKPERHPGVLGDDETLD